jgi:hypothetical protein
MEVSYCSPGSM